MKITTLTVVLLVAASSTRAQVAGHGTVPTTGPAARERVDRPEQDALLVQLERVRGELEKLGKTYRKAKGAEREALARRVQPLLDQMASSLRDLRDGGATQEN